MIRRNPGVSWLIFSAVFTFVLGVGLTQVNWMPEVKNTIWQCWILIMVWYLTMYNARWAGRLMRRHVERLKT